MALVVALAAVALALTLAAILLLIAKMPFIQASYPALRVAAVPRFIAVSFAGFIGLFLVALGPGPWLGGVLNDLLQLPHEYKFRGDDPPTVLFGIAFTVFVYGLIFVGNRWVKLQEGWGVLIFFEALLFIFVGFDSGWSAFNRDSWFLYGSKLVGLPFFLALIAVQMVSFIVKTRFSKTETTRTPPASPPRI